MVKKIFACLAVFLFSLLIFLIVLMPASFVWDRLLEPNLSLASSGVRVEQVSGGIWDGQALLSYQGVDTLVDWDVRFSGLLSLRLPLELNLKSHVGTAQAMAYVGLNEASIKLNTLDADLSAINTILSRRRITLDGQLLARDITLQVEGRQLVQVDGQFSWSGGNIAYPVGREVHERSVPVFRGRLETLEDGTNHVGISDPDSPFDLIELSVLPDGVALLQVRRRLLDLVEEPWSINSDERDVVFKVKKDLY